MANVTFDKKQLPQVAVLGVLSLGLFGFFILKMMGPPASHAAPPSTTTPATSPSATGTSAASGTTTSTSADPTDGATPDSPSTAALIGAAPPSPGMRDPFASDIAALPKAPVTAKPGAPAPSIPSLPGSGDVQPLPALNGSVPVPAPPAPAAAWNVTGIIRSDTRPGAAIAIFRLGDTRRYVRLGQMIDDDTRLIGIDRGGVTILRAGTRIRLPLGGPVTPSAPKPTAIEAPPVAFGSTSTPMPQIAPTPASSGTATPAASAAAIAGTIAGLLKPT